MNDNTYVSRKEFITYFEAVTGMDRHTALENGILASEDVVRTDEPITRRACARIYHMMLLHIIGEADEEDWTAALQLQDIYDCHSCVYHIAQVYAKGIMGTQKQNLFGAEALVATEEMKDSFSKLFDASVRSKPVGRAVTFRSCLGDEAEQLLMNKDKVIVVDVREPDEYHKKVLLEGSVNIPLTDINKNPYCVSDDRNIPVYLMCARGYQSAVAARLLVKYGYTNVNVIRWQ